jgi:hypothetical protein
LILAGFLPDERYSLDAGHLGNLRVDLDLAVAEVDAELLLLLRGKILVAEDYIGVGVSQGNLSSTDTHRRRSARY